MRIQKIRFFQFLILIALMAGCAAYTINHPIQRIDRSTGYRLTSLKAGENTKTLWVVLAFSGGGTRAAAFSYGVLKALANTEIEWEGKRRSLLQEVDVISSVSGGSFTSAYYGLFRDRIFQDFEKKFLRANIEGALIAKVFLPGYWFRFMAENFDRGDMAAEYYDEILFEGKTFADLQKNGKPILWINATDMSLGTGFTFNQNYFDAICSNLSKYPISRAVTASSAFPVAFTPITILNYSGKCRYETPPGLRNVLKYRNTFSRDFRLAKTLRRYQDPNYKYLHLLDGGISDNLGLRTPLRAMTASGNVWNLVKLRGNQNIRRVLVIVVDSKSDPEKNWWKLPSVSGIIQMLDAATGAQVERYSFETLNLVATNLDKWTEEIRKGRCKEMPSDWCGDIKVDLVHLSFDGFPTEKERKYYFSIPTKLALPNETVDRLIQAPELLLKRNHVYQRFLEGLKGKRLR